MRCSEVSERYGLQVPVDALVAGPPGRRPAARRDRQGADPRRPGAHPRRAHRGAHPAGDRRPDARSCAPLKDGGHLDRLHHPQAARGAGGRRPDHRHPARQGRRRGAARPPPSAELASMMVGRPVKLEIEKDAGAAGRRGRSRSTDLRVVDPTGQVTVDGVSFSVRAGEIYALAGVQGNGQTELTEALVGLETVESGTVRSRATTSPGPGSTPCSSWASATCPRTGCTTAWSAASRSPRTSSSTCYDREPFSRGMSLDLDRIRQNATERVEEFDVRTSSIEHPASTLSGGNQQKVVLARELSRPLKVLIVGPAHARPRRRLDGVRAQAHRRRARQRRRRDRGVHRARRGARARRPDRRHVPRQDHRRAAGRRRPGRDRPADGRQRRSTRADDRGRRTRRCRLRERADRRPGRRTAARTSRPRTRSPSPTGFWKRLTRQAA